MTGSPTTPSPRPDASAAAASERAAERRWHVLLVFGLVLTGLSMRTAVTSVGSELDAVEKGLGIGSGAAGVITTLPVIAFAGLGAVTPRLTRRIGAHQLLVGALIVMTLGLLLRVLVSSIWLFVPLSLLALAGGAVSNVLMPTLVKDHFPQELGRMTAVYTTALAIGLTAASGLTEPIMKAFGSWRYGLGAWAVLSALAIVPWLRTLRHDPPAEVRAAEDDSVERQPFRTSLLWRSGTARALTLFFTFQSFQAYIAFGWFPKFLHAHGIDEVTAGWMVAVLAAMSIPVSMIVPNIPPRRQVWAVSGLSLCYVASYLGLALAPVGGAWLWMVLNGIGGGSFPVALTLIGLRARTSASTAALSGFVQPIGYLVAGTGPLLFGVLYGATGGWAVPMALLFGAIVLSWLGALRACRDVYVDDEVGADARVADRAGVGA